MSNTSSKDKLNKSLNKSVIIPIKDRLRTATKSKSNDKTNPTKKSTPISSPIQPVTIAVKKTNIHKNDNNNPKNNISKSLTKKKNTPLSKNSCGASHNIPLTKQIISTGTQTNQAHDNELVIKLTMQLSEKDSIIQELMQKVLCLEELLLVKWESDHDKETPPPTGTCQPELSDMNQFTCHIIGDSHVRGLSEKLSELLPAGCTAQAVFQPGAGYEAVADTHTQSPKLVKPSPYDPVIVMCGTNDVCNTEWESIQRSIERISVRFQQSKTLYFIGVPFRYDHRKINFHISRLNAKIKTCIKSSSNNQNVQYIDPNKFLKPRDYTVDKLHLNRSGKLKLCRKIKNYFIRSPSPPSLPHKTLVPDIYDHAPHYTTLPELDNLIDLEPDDEITFSNDPPLYHDSTNNHTVILADPSQSLLDTPNFPQHVNNIILNENQSAMDHYRLTSLTHSFSNAIHSSPLITPGRPIETISGFRPSQASNSTFSATPPGIIKT